MAQHDRKGFRDASWPLGGTRAREWQGPRAYGDYAGSQYGGVSSEGRGYPESDFLPHRASDDPRSRWSGDTPTTGAGVPGGYGAYGGYDWHRAEGVHEARESYAGRGPRGYKRSDARLREDVSDALEQDPYVDASDIDVSIEDGEITLRGTVATRDQKRRAEDCAAAVRGVRDVSNQLRLARPADRQASAPETSSSLLGLGGQPPKDAPQRS